MRIREVKTGSGKRAVQVVSKRYGKVTVHRHIGSFGTETERTALYLKAQEFIEKNTGQTRLGDWAAPIHLSEIEITESRPLFVYELLSGVYDKIGLNRFADPAIKDLVIGRIVYPTSKLELQEILSEYFGRHYGRNLLRLNSAT